MNYRKLSAFFFAMAVPGVVLAANITPEELDEQQASLNQINYRLDSVLHSVSQYNLAREQYYLGGDGVVVLAESWYQNHLNWLNDMDQLRRKLSDYKILAQSDIGEFKIQLSILMNNLHQSLEDAKMIRKKADVGTELLVNIPNYPEDYIDELKPIIPALNNNVTLSHSAFENLSSDFSSERMKRLEDALFMTSDVIESLINRSKLQFPELTASLIKLKQIFAVDSLVEVPVSNASKSAAFIQAQARRNWFLADIHFAKFEKQYLQDRKRIVGSPLDESLKKPSLDFIDKKYNQAKYYLDISKKRAYVHLYQFYNTTINKYARMCKNSDNYQRNNCALLKSLIGLDRETIKKMNLDQQRYLYTQLMRVPKPPFMESSQ